MEKNFRNELKYAVPEAYFGTVFSRLSCLFSSDENEVSEDGYLIRSVYFDDSALSSFNDKISGVRDRKKYRIRIYNFSCDYISLEKKEKRGEKVRKISQRIDKSIFFELVSGNAASFSEDGGLLGEFGNLSREKYIFPQVVVDYNRKSFVSAVSKTRITLDSHLSSSPFDENTFFEKNRFSFPVWDDGTFIVEVKNNGVLLPQISDAFSDIPKIKCANSKYCLCLDALKRSIR